MCLIGAELAVGHVSHITMHRCITMFHSKKSLFEKIRDGFDFK